MPSDLQQRCPLCRGERTRVRWRGLGDRLFGTTTERFDVGGCDSCGARFLVPIPAPERLGAFYPAGYWVGTSEGAGEANGRNGAGRADSGTSAPAPPRGLMERYRRFVLRDHVRFVGAVVRAQRQRGLAPRILDVGCGDGSFLAALGERDCTGMDLSLPALRTVRSRGIRAVRGTPDAAPLRRGAFTLVTAFHFLEHVHPPEPVLAALRELLQPGGDLVLQVPNVASWQAALLGRHWAGLDVPRHLVDYSHTTLRRLLESCGFTVVAENHHCLRDNPTTLANSLVPRLYPPGRVARGGRTNGARALAADLGYLAVTLACTPFSILEALCGRGASVMVHACPTGS